MSVRTSWLLYGAACCALLASVRAEVVMPSAGTMRSAPILFSEPKIQAVFVEASETILKATKASDLDSILEKIARMKRVYQSDPGRRRAEMQGLGEMEQFTNRWQQYLLQSESNADVSSSLSDLASSFWFPLVPRSEILRRAALSSREGSNRESKAVRSQVEDEKVVGIVSRFRTLDDVAKGVEELKGLEKLSKNGGGAVLRNAMSFFAPMDEAYRKFQAGEASSIDLTPYSQSTGVVRGKAVELLRQLMLLIIPRVLEVPSGVEVAVRSGEEPEETLGRIAKEAGDRGDHFLAARARDLKLLISSASSSKIAQSSRSAVMPSGDQLFIKGYRQEMAGDDAMAVSLYLVALASGDEGVPLKYIGERLANIKARNVTGFQKGQEVGASIVAWLSELALHGNNPNTVPSWGKDGVDGQSLPPRDFKMVIPALSPSPDSKTSND